MSWASFGDFLHMGGYGVYVWGSYSVTIALLALEALSLSRKERSTLARLQRELGGSESR
jgi:heme exporter protein D